MAKAPEWLLVAVFCLLAVATLALLGGFGYFAWKNPDVLRSEKFMLTKLALEKSKSVKGDHLTGLVEAIISEGQPSLTPPATNSPGSHAGDQS